MVVSYDGTDWHGGSLKMELLLGNGYIDLVEVWGSEEGIIESARMSTGKGFKGWEEDEKLLQFLYRNKHTSPFEMAGATFEVKAPIVVFREWHRHRTQSYNEFSARYSVLPDENYLPTLEQVRRRCAEAVTSSNKQASSFRMPTDVEIEDWIGKTELAFRLSQEAYDYALSVGIPKELSRLPVPVARFSKMRASANLLNWLRFLELRTSPRAQWEIRQYALAISRILESVFPRTLSLFKEEGFR